MEKYPDWQGIKGRSGKSYPGSCDREQTQRLFLLLIFPSSFNTLFPLQKKVRRRFCERVKTKNIRKCNRRFFSPANFGVGKFGKEKKNFFSSFFFLRWNSNFLASNFKENWGETTKEEKKEEAAAPNVWQTDAFLPPQHMCVWTAAAAKTETVWKKNFWKEEEVWMQGGEKRRGRRAGRGCLWRYVCWVFAESGLGGMAGRALSEVFVSVKMSLKLGFRKENKLTLLFLSIIFC